MKNLLLVLLVVLSTLSHSQEKESNYFTFHKGGKKYLKPVKYILFDSLKDKKSIYKTDIYFYVKGNKFKFSRVKQKVDTCSLKNFKKIKFSKVLNLQKEGYDFYLRKMKEDIYWKDKINRHPMPVEINPYVKVILVSLKTDYFIKYEVIWEQSHPYD